MFWFLIFSESLAAPTVLDDLLKVRLDDLLDNNDCHAHEFHVYIVDDIFFDFLLDFSKHSTPLATGGYVSFSMVVDLNSSRLLGRLPNDLRKEIHDEVLKLFFDRVMSPLIFISYGFDPKEFSQTKHAE